MTNQKTELLTQETKRAEIVLEQAKASVDHFRKAFDTVRAHRQAGTRGSPTNEEQDLIRASLIFSAAGLDSVIKELIKGSIKVLVTQNGDAQNIFQEYVRRQLRGDPESNEISTKFLAKVLASQNSHDALIKNYTEDLTRNSLQSVEELSKASNALGVTINRINQNRPNIKEVFSIRNKIIHELDANFDAKKGQRHRNSRTRKELDEKSDLLLQIASDFIGETKKKLSEASGSAID